MRRGEAGDGEAVRRLSPSPQRPLHLLLRTLPHQLSVLQVIFTFLALGELSEAPVNEAPKPALPRHCCQHTTVKIPPSPDLSLLPDSVALRENV